ncbi:DUF4397 domain-containing protein [Mucilaginibacter auburnensis]|uniref:Uncharacterized protein DUF4397 n=1 Tax=Mucilaginibacter auburnensis TaxID=1457233 RepID=A0A2H9VPF9_9SPHI|nr:DUF4397 domain-containing protein [Mucilaginibacter auburnensis]PJJ80170.1 uncharacterized protein DUF4397 [Mucilaginibacter auburnensis]
MALIKLIQKRGLTWVFIAFAGFLITAGTLSCSNTNNVLPVGANTQFQIVNLSPDLRPINLYVRFVKRNVAYSYPTPSGYFGMTSIDTPLQIRSALASVSTANLISIDTILKANTKYTLFVTGLRADSSITGIFTVDTGSNTPGRGKVRFVNASPGAVGLDVKANGTAAFANQEYKKVSKFIEMAPGSYDFVITPTGAPANILRTLQKVSIQDGKLYTIYAHGIAGRRDSAAFNAGVLINR